MYINTQILLFLLPEVQKKKASLFAMRYPLFSEEIITQWCLTYGGGQGSDL